jgi:hypothetical protein
VRHHEWTFPDYRRADYRILPTCISRGSGDHKPLRCVAGGQPSGDTTRVRQPVSAT